MATTEDQFTTYGPIFFKALPAKALEELNDIRAKDALDPLETTGLSPSWERFENLADELEKKQEQPADPLAWIMSL